MLKALFVLKILKFFVLIAGEQLHKYRINIKYHRLLKISGIKGKQTMKLNHSMDYKMKHIFLKNHTQNLVNKQVPDI